MQGPAHVRAASREGPVGEPAQPIINRRSRARQCGGMHEGRPELFCLRHSRCGWGGLAYCLTRGQHAPSARLGNVGEPPSDTRQRASSSSLCHTKPLTATCVASDDWCRYSGRAAHLHAARVGCLAELTPELREPRARLVDVRDSDPEMAEAAAHLLPVLRAGGVSVARIVHRALLRLGPVVPGQLNAAGGAHAEGKAVVGVGRDAGRIDWCHKIDVEAPLRELPVHHQVEAEHVAVEGKRGLRVLHAQHLTQRRSGAE
eukprot:scaffold8733_cov114-Isochrysis_galbana.AAC.6